MLVTPSGEQRGEEQDWPGKEESATGSPELSGPLREAMAARQPFSRALDILKEQEDQQQAL